MLSIAVAVLISSDVKANNALRNLTPKVLWTLRKGRK
jgi:hypothetical protein